MSIAKFFGLHDSIQYIKQSRRGAGHNAAEAVKNFIPAMSGRLGAHIQYMTIGLLLCIPIVIMAYLHNKLLHAAAVGFIVFTIITAYQKFWGEK